MSKRELIIAGVIIAFFIVLSAISSLSNGYEMQQEYNISGNVDKQNEELQTQTWYTSELQLGNAWDLSVVINENRLPQLSNNPGFTLQI